MRLINTKTLQLEEEDQSGERLRYAILSHRWQAKEEVTFQDLQGTEQSQAERGVYKKKGFYKIRKACEKATEENLAHLWVDTCCIDKSSSTELHEAINSMYRWYSEATVCFAYLFDVDDPEEGKVFERSDWFKRGWTLQELLAPKKVTFFNAKWQRLGDRTTLSGKIATASGISVDILETPSRINERSIAERMSWASDRSTTRTEDMAYSLLGIFGIHMPLIYGEEENAFIRLQEEIIKKSNDQSIFAWSGVEAGHPGLLARSPKAFKESGNIREVADISSFSVGKKGIEMTARMCLHSAYTYLAQLSCAKEPEHEMVGIFLRQLPGSKDYVRVKAKEGDWVKIKKKDQLSFPVVERIMICQRLDPGLREDSYLIQPDFRFRVSGNAREQLFTPLPEGPTEWDEAEQAFVLPNGKVNSSGMIGALKFRSSDVGIQVIRLGFDSYSNPVCMVAKWYAVKSSTSPGNLTRRCIGPPLALVLAFTIVAIPFSESILRTVASHNGKGVFGYGSDGLRDFDATEKLGTTHVRSGINRDGLYILKGDRATGLDVFLTDEFKNSKCTHVTIKRGDSSGRFVWDVDVREVSHSSTRRKD